MPKFQKQIFVYEDLWNDYLGTELASKLASEQYRAPKGLTHVFTKNDVDNSYLLNLKIETAAREIFPQGYEGVEFGTDEFRKLLKRSAGRGRSLIKLLDAHPKLESLLAMSREERTSMSMKKVWKKIDKKAFFSKLAPILLKTFQEQRKKRALGADLEEELQKWTPNSVCDFLSSRLDFHPFLASIWDSCGETRFGYHGLLRTVRYSVLLEALRDSNLFAFYLGSARLGDLLRRYCESLVTHMSWARPIEGSFGWYFQVLNSPSDVLLTKMIQSHLKSEHTDIEVRDTIGLSFTLGKKIVNCEEIVLFRAEMVSPNLTASVVQALENSSISTFFPVKHLEFPSHQWKKKN